MARTQNAVTADQRAGGQRMRQLRMRWGFTQENLLPENRSAVSGVENGTNLLSGPLRDKYAAAFGVDPRELTAYQKGELSLEDLVAASVKPPQGAVAVPRRGRRKLSEQGTSPPPPDLSSHDELEPLRRHAAARLQLPPYDYPEVRAKEMVMAVLAFKHDTALESDEIAALADHIQRSLDGLPERPSTVPPAAKAAAKRELTETREKRNGVRPRQTGK